MISLVEQLENAGVQSVFLFASNFYGEHSPAAIQESASAVNCW